MIVSKIYSGRSIIRTRCFLLILSTLLFQFAIVSCSPPSQRHEEAKLEQKDNLRRQIQQMATKHNADIQWMEILQGRELYTIELQQALLEPKPRPRLLIAAITDVMKRENSYFLTAHEWASNIYFQLECNEQHTRYILSTATNDARMFQDLAIVLVPKSVHKPIAQLTSEIDGETATVTHEPAKFFVVKGVCLEILTMGELQLDLKDLSENSGSHFKN